MPVTFNTNNNYNVEIITEPDTLSLVNPFVHGAPQAIKYSSITNTPYIEVKITPDLYQYPLLAGNMNFDGLYRFIDWRAQNNVNNTCSPPATPHGINSTNTWGFTPFPGATANGTVCTLPQITTNVQSSRQGPFESHRPFGAYVTDQLNNGVAWTKVIWVEVYEDDNGQIINTQFSPEINEDLASWQLWNPLNPNTPITNNVYPQYIRAFVFLEFGPSGPVGLTNNVDIFIDIDEDEPVYGCTDPNADNTTPGATIDDGSCTYALVPYNVYVNESQVVHSGAFTNYSDPPFASEVPEYDFVTSTLGTLNLNSLPIMPKNLELIGGQFTFSSTYVAGDNVTETISFMLRPRLQVSNTGLQLASAIFDFPHTGGPEGPGADMTDSSTFLGNAQNNLVAASLYVNNIDPDTGNSAGRNVYLANGTTIGTSTSDQPNWVPDVGYADSEGDVPKTVCQWQLDDDKLEFVQPDGTIFTAFVTDFYVEEDYDTGGNYPIPGYEWFPQRLVVHATISFTMPANDVYLNFDFVHDTDRINPQ